jgi:hypothetical protein
MEKSKSTKTTIKKSSSPRPNHRVKDSKRSFAKKSGGGSLDPGPNKPKK